MQLRGYFIVAAHSLQSEDKEWVLILLSEGQVHVSYIEQQVIYGELFKFVQSVEISSTIANTTTVLTSVSHSFAQFGF